MGFKLVITLRFTEVPKTEKLDLYCSLIWPLVSEFRRLILGYNQYIVMYDKIENQIDTWIQAVYCYV